MSRETDSVDYFSFNRICLQLAGVWEVNYDAKWKRILFFVYNLYTKLYCLSFFIAELIYLLQESKNDIRLFTKNIIWLITHFFVFYKVSLWYWKRRIVFNIMEELNQPKYFYEPQQEFNPNTIMKGYDRLNYFTVSAHFWVGGLIPVTAGLGTIVSIIIDPNSVNRLDHDGNVIFCKNLPFTTWIPYHIDNKFKCALASILQANGILTYGYIIIALDAAFTSMINYLTAHFKILQEAFKTIIIRSERKILIDKQDSQYNEELSKCVNAEVKKCIQYLQTLFRLTEDLESTYRYQTLVQTLVTLLVFCGILYLISTITFDNKSFFSEVFYMVAVAIELSLYAWFGNELTLSSIEITEALYESDWINLSESAKKCILITMIRMTKPAQLSVGMFTPLTLQTLITIFRASYSFYAVLKQVE